MDIVWSPRARRNRDAIHAAIARDDPARAHAVITEIVTAINRLADFPALGRPGRKSGTRELVLARRPYLVVYRVRASNVQILEILHTSRQRS
jgi:toxin ParE1/3/4